MKAISNTVGETGANTRHDSALIQAALFACRRPAQFDIGRSRYLATIDGNFGPRSRAALRLFQTENVFVDHQRRVSTTVANATAGQVRAGDATWQALERLIDPAFSGLSYVTGSRIPFIGGTQMQFDASRLQANQEVFTPAFRAKLIRLLEAFHRDHRIVLAICPQGARRTFQQQYDLLVGPGQVTNAGPGESNHNFGQAADIGFPRLRWLTTTGTITENETHWLHRMTASAGGSGEALIFWNAMRATGESGEVGLFRGPVADRPHLQAWSDTNVSMRRSLAGHLSAVGAMRWGTVQGGYSCNLGSGTVMHGVGTAAQIWSKTGPVTPPMVQAAGLPVAPAQMAASIGTLRDRLRADFDASDASWTTWQPL